MPVISIEVLYKVINNEAICEQRLWLCKGIGTYYGETAECLKLNVRSYYVLQRGNLW